MKVHFFLKDPAGGKDTLIYIAIYYRAKRIKLSTGETIHPDLWLDERARRINNHPELSSLNMRLDNLESAVKDEYYKLITADPSVEVEYLKQKLTERIRKIKPVSHATIYSYFDQVINQYKHQHKNHKSMQTTRNMLKAWRPNLKLDDIDVAFYNDLIKFMSRAKVVIKGEEQIGYSKNYVGRVIKNIKILMNYAIEEGATTNKKWMSKKFTRQSEKVYNVYNDVGELVKIFNTDLSKIPGAAKARDLYLVSAFTGLRFSDYRNLDPANFTGDEYIIQDMQKVSGRIIVPLHWIVKEILSRHNGTLPPAPSNQKMNDHIKTIGQKAGIDTPIIKTRTIGGKKKQISLPKWKMMSTHTARRSMATNMYLAGIPLLTISKLLGHSDVKQTLDYIKITEIELSQSLSNHPFFTERIGGESV